MRKEFIYVLAAFFCWSTLFATNVLSGEKDIEILDSINGKNFLSVELAVKELYKNYLLPSDYNITIMKVRGKLVISFVDTSGPDENLRVMPQKPSFEVHMSADGLSVERSYFSR